MDEFFEEKSYCYIEPSMMDKNTAEDVKELYDNVWYKMKPPKRTSTAMFSPFVTARQIDLVRAVLLGRSPLKTGEVNIEPVPEPHTDPPRKKSSKEKINIDKRKSSVRFLNKLIYD